MKRKSVPGSASTDSPAAPDPHAALDDAQPGVLLHLMVAERLARLQLEQDGAGLVVGVQDDRIALAVGHLDLRQLPGLHDPQG